jgi:alpha-amylase/alpha-mannosidase (GH57 family)
MTRVAILWHMHQPFYQDLVTGEHILPWVRLHALKDYWGMVALLREFPDVRVTFNLVPSLLVQLDAFARDDARDRHLEIGLKPAAELSDEERAFCLEHFFHAHRERMIEPYPRYRELLEQRERNGGSSGPTRPTPFTVDALRDLQVWHKLAWVDAEYHATDERTRGLVRKGRGFSEEDKQLLRQVELELLRRVIPEYAAAAGRGQVELSTSPFYHPILPLLCDTDIYKRTHPHSRLPRQPFRHPEDATEQLVRARALHERLFGDAPRGVWPSEGAVSDAMVPLVAAAGFQWMATDEEILGRSRGVAFTRSEEGHIEQPGTLYRPYLVGRDGARIACGFRDHALSDLIGFTYAGWSADGAATDFLHRVVEAGRRFAAENDGAEATVFVILDGENAWEHFDGQGRPFLRALYGRLASHPEVRTVTMSEACAGATEVLPSIFPGSWIHGDFYIWIGHADDHHAWSQLAEARRALEQRKASIDESARARACEEMLIAEGSDWFWWYGDDHSSAHDVEFDDLFRRHVRNVYRALEEPTPEELFVSNITTQPPAVDIQAPTGFIAPSIDGEVTHYFEWLGAGSVTTAAVTGAMHQVAEGAAMLRVLEFGFDLDHLFVRLDGEAPMRELLDRGIGVVIKFVEPGGLQVRVESEAGMVSAHVEERQTGGAWRARPAHASRAVAGAILEIAIPFRELGAATHTPLAFLVTVTQAGREVEQHPRHRPIDMVVPGAEFPAWAWTA